MGKNETTWTDTNYATKKIHSLLNVSTKYVWPVPDVGSVEDVLLQQCEIKVECTHPKYLRNVMHVFAQNKYCDEWNEFMLKSLPGDT